MAGLDLRELNQVLTTLHKYADKKLTPEFLLDLDHKDEFPQDVLDELYQDRTPREAFEKLDEVIFKP